ncbi:unnamed protein product [Bemisia tabaci]|uniref:Nuclear receptor coactivator 5 n=1 Tax=Bemisia tabaci TaxID=7038 RepID=A0A9P0A9C7_BEMTA|nr:unnamed protein product [Bemisia tabaci]
MDNRPGIRPRMDDRGAKRPWRDSQGDGGGRGRGAGYGGPPPFRFRGGRGGRGGGRGGGDMGGNDMGGGHDPQDGPFMERDEFFKGNSFGRGGPPDRKFDRGPPGHPDRGMPDRGMPNRGMPDRGMPDRGMPDRGMPDRDMPDRPPPDRDLPNDRFRADGPPPEFVKPEVPALGQDRTNDVEIIVVNRHLTEYAEIVESHLKNLGMSVDLLFPNEDVPLGRVLANISSRGTLYACLVLPANAEHRSLTVNILHGQPQEHRNMPLQDALKLITRDFDSYRLQNEKGPGGIPLQDLTPSTSQHPEPIQMLLNALAANRQVTVLQFDKIIAYLREKREVQLKLEVGDTKLPSTTEPNPANPQQAELQHRILNILNQSGGSGNPAGNGPQRGPFNGPPQKGGPPQQQNRPGGPGGPPGSNPPLLNDPNVQKAIDNLLQGDLMKKIGPNSNPPSQPLFGAFANNSGGGPPGGGRGRGRF